MSADKVFKIEVDDGIAFVTMDLPGEPMNTWTDEFLNGYSSMVESLGERKDLKGLILLSGKPHNFHSGANLKFLEQFETREELSKALDGTHKALNSMENVGFPTVAAINGHCLGGGYELALACTARVAKESKTTVIGLPECLVGLFPGGGGTQRLLRLIGYPAFELILTGKNLTASQALEAGLVDHCVASDGDLLAEAKELLVGIINGNVSLKRPQFDSSGLDMVADTARKQTLKATRGREIPGPMLAIKAMQEGGKLSLAEGLAIEKEYFLDVALSTQAKGSIHTFFLKTETDKPANMIPRGFEPRPLKKLAILGFGTMGRGIAIEVLRRMRIPLVVKDTPEALEQGQKFLQKILGGMAEKKRLPAPVDELLSLLVPVSDFNDQFGDVDLVIEAVFEDPKVKDEVYGQLMGYIDKNCLVASNTSTIPISRMTGAVSNPQRFAGAHFFSPVWKMELLEIIRGKETSDETIYNLLNFAAEIRKRPVICKDNPGFIVNAILLPYFLKIYDLLEKGVSIEMIDQAMIAFGMPVGPVRLIDEIGIDVHYKAFGAMGIEPPAILEKVIEDGRYGFKKSGKGFFLGDGSVDPAVQSMIEVKDKLLEFSIEEVQLEFYQAMVKKGNELLNSGVVDNPKDIDVAMIWGVGFPPDKGGLMKWADLTGLSREIRGSNFY